MEKDEREAALFAFFHHSLLSSHLFFLFSIIKDNKAIFTVPLFQPFSIINWLSSVATDKPFCFVLHRYLIWKLKLFLGPVIFVLCLFCIPVAHKPFVITADSTGTHSLYTTYKDYELMFHVSTLLPYTPNNRQQVSYFIFNNATIKIFFK